MNRELSSLQRKRYQVHVAAARVHLTQGNPDAAARAAKAAESIVSTGVTRDLFTLIARQREILAQKPKRR